MAVSISYHPFPSTGACPFQVLCWAGSCAPKRPGNRTRLSVEAQRTLYISCFLWPACPYGDSSTHFPGFQICGRGQDLGLGDLPVNVKKRAPLDGENGKRSPVEKGWRVSPVSPLLLSKELSCPLQVPSPGSPLQPSPWLRCLHSGMLLII